MLTGAWAVEISLGAFVVSALMLVVVGSRFTRLVDRLADRTGLGEALAGAVLLGATTSLPGLVTTVVGASAGDASFAVSNALGGIAAQTMFLALADLVYRRANLEHAAASVPNLLQSVVLIALIGLVLLGVLGPDLVVLGLHPITLLLPAAYVYGLRLVASARRDPMWRPQQTAETRTDVPEEANLRESLFKLWIKFAVAAATVAATGFVVARAGLSITEQTALSGTLVGGLITSVVTSLPELVTVIAAVRVGALTLAVGDIIGGNIFDVLFVAAGDVAYDGSIYQAVDTDTMFVMTLTLVLASVLAAGLVHRGRRGIGFEGIAILVLYVGGFSVLFLSG